MLPSYIYSGELARASHADKQSCMTLETGFMLRAHGLGGGTKWCRQASGQTLTRRHWRALARADPGDSLFSLGLDPVR